MKSTRTHLIIVVVIAALAVGGHVFWYNIILAKSAEVSNLQGEIGQASQVVTRIASDRALLEQASSSQSEVQNYFVSNNNIVPFINSLQNTGSSLGSTVTVLSVSSTGRGQTSIALALTITGSFDAVMRTVGAIEYAPYAITMTSLTMQKSPNTGWTASVNFSVESVNTSS